MAGLIASCIFCDDVRSESDGKFTFVGVYPNDMVLHIASDKEGVPALAKFFIVCSLKDLDKRKKHSIVISQTGADDKVIEIDKEATRSDKKMIFILDVMNFRVPEEGKLEVFLQSGADKHKIDEIGLIYKEDKAS